MGRPDGLCPLVSSGGWVKGCPPLFYITWGTLAPFNVQSLSSLSHTLSFFKFPLSSLVVLCSFQVVGLREILGQQGGPSLVSGKGMDHFLSLSCPFPSSLSLLMVLFLFHVAIQRGVKVGPSILDLFLDLKSFKGGAWRRTLQALHFIIFSFFTLPPCACKE